MQCQAGKRSCMFRKTCGAVPTVSVRSPDVTLFSVTDADPGKGAPMTRTTLQRDAHVKHVCRLRASFPVQSSVAGPNRTLASRALHVGRSIRT